VASEGLPLCWEKAPRILESEGAVEDAIFHAQFLSAQMNRQRAEQTGRGSFRVDDGTEDQWEGIDEASRLRMEADLLTSRMRKARPGMYQPTKDDRDKPRPSTPPAGGEGAFAPELGAWTTLGVPCISFRNCEACPKTRRVLRLETKLQPGKVF